jgi:hypothetical protein
MSLSAVQALSSPPAAGNGWRAVLSPFIDNKVCDEVVLVRERQM